MRFGEVLPIVHCDFYQLALEGFHSVGEMCVIHGELNFITTLTMNHVPCCSPKEKYPASGILKLMRETYSEAFQER
jgi:hypothetical protein